MSQRDPHQLREDAASAVARGKFETALALYSELEQLEPNAAAWPKRVGETHRRMGDAASAVTAFERAVDKYVRDGLLVQAIAVCKLILQIEPQHATIAVRLAELARPTPAEARAVRARSPSVMTKPALEIDDVQVKRSADSRREDTPPPSRAALLVSGRATSDTATELAQRASRRPVTLPPGGGLDAIPLALVMPESMRVVRDDGTDAGMSVLRIDVDFDEVDDDVEIEIVDPRRMALLKTPVFSALPADVLESLINQLELRDLYNGEEVFREGDIGTTMFVISEGEVEVEASGQDLATLGPGAFFGEIALITDLPRSATIRAKGKVELLCLDREVVRAAEIVTALLQFVRDRLVDRVARTSPLFRPFSEQERALLAGRFEVVEVDAGAQLITFGHKSNGLYVVLAGKVDVSRDGEGNIATLACGDVFGEMSLMGNRGSTANVRALTRVLALRLPAAVFQEIILTYPQVLEYLGDLTSSRSRLARAEEFLDLHITLV